MDFSEVSGRLEGLNALHNFQALTREHALFFSTQTPSILMLSDKGIFIGGSAATRNEYMHIPLAKIIECRLYGRSLWRSVKLVYELEKQEKEIYIQPFTGHPTKPKLDLAEMENLHDTLKQILYEQGVRI